MNLSRSAKPAAIENRFTRVAAISADALAYMNSIDPNGVVSAEELDDIKTLIARVEATAHAIAFKARGVHAAKLETKAAKRAAKEA